MDETRGEIIKNRCKITNKSIAVKIRNKYITSFGQSLIDSANEALAFARGEYSGCAVYLLVGDDPSDSVFLLCKKRGNHAT